MTKKTDKQSLGKPQRVSAPIEAQKKYNPFNKEVNLNFDQQYPPRLYPVPGLCRSL